MEQITTQTMLVHPVEAEQWLIKENYHRQRSLRRHHVQYLAQAMLAGRFRAGTQIAFAVHAGRRHLINGQHTLAAIVLSECPIWLDVQETVVDSLNEVARLYGRFDRGLTRTLVDTYTSRGLAEYSGLNREQTTNLGSCLPNLCSGFSVEGGSRGGIGVFLRDQDLRGDMMMDWAEEGRAFYDDIRGTPGFLYKVLTRAAVMSVALVTYRYTGADASEFWRDAGRDDALSIDHPIKSLLRFLQENEAKRYAQHHYSRFVAAAWNAAFEDRTLQKLRARDPELPIIIAGTPHKGAEVMQYISHTGAILHDPIPSTKEGSNLIMPYLGKWIGSLLDKKASVAL